MSDDSLTPSDLLIAGRERFERHLPVPNRPKTEPDCKLLLSGHYLILIEAEFCSKKLVTYPGQRRSSQSLTKDELLNLEEALGTPVSESKTAEFYTAANNEQHVQQK